MIVDPFSGPRGWDVGLRAVTDELSVGIEIDADACATSRAAGFPTLQRDVAAVDPRRFRHATGAIFSPPCTAFSNAGKRKGRRWLPVLVHAIGEQRWDHGLLRRQDPTIWLPLEVGRWVEAIRPEWVALEQVPPALALWHAYQVVLARWGYDSWAGVLRAEQYGVPQTRQRAFLIASRVREVTPPVPTHSRYYNRDPERLDPGVEKWVSMAEALGWGMTDRPAVTIPAAGNVGGGPRPLDGGSGARKTIRREIEAGRWLNSGRTATQPNRRLYHRDEPAPTIGFGHDAANWRWELNTGRDWKPGGDRSTAQRIPIDQPAPSLDSQGGKMQWWVERPATTIAGDPRVFPPGGHIANDGRDNSRMVGRSATKIRLTIDQALVLQSFPPDYPVQGTKTSQFRQVGNAVPPRLAAAVLGQVVSNVRQEASA